jgi:hypothetical protein
VTTPIAVPEPDDQLADPKQLLLDYLDYYRSAIARKVDGLSDAALRGILLPSGWSPIEMVKHLLYMERRWLEWGFLGAQVGEPWGDRGPDGRWAVSGDDSAADLISRLYTGGERTRGIVERASLQDVAAAGGRFGPDDRRPTLAWILFHVLQEYARHAGHLDIVRELIDGSLGE